MATDAGVIMKKPSLQDSIECTWRKWAPYWHVSTVIVGAIAYGIFWFHDVDGARAQTIVNTSDIYTLKQSVAVIQEQNNDMKNELHAVWQVIVKHK